MNVYEILRLYAKCLPKCGSNSDFLSSTFYVQLYIVIYSVVTETVKLTHMYFSVEGIVVKFKSSKKYDTFPKFDQHYGRLVGI